MLLTIEKLIYGGDGLARTEADMDGRTLAVFVPFVLPGEKVEVDVRPGKGGFSRATTGNILEPSRDRVKAPCPYFQQCGGCHYQHIPYESQVDVKAQILRETLRRVAKIELQTEITLHESPPWNYRNRTRLRIRTAPKFELGYFKFGSHDFLAVDECPISSPLLNKVIAGLVELGGLNCPRGVEEIELFADAEDSRLLAWAYCGPDAESKKLLAWAAALQAGIGQLTGVTFFGMRRELTGAQRRKSKAGRDADRDGELLDLKPIASSGAASMQYRTGEIEYCVSAGAFFQVNRFLIGELVSVVTGHAKGDVALDLYAGGGLFSAALARNFHHIFGVEASLTSIGDFRHNVPANVKAISARTETYLQGDLLRSGALRGRPDLIVLDPPRSGVGNKGMRALVDLGAPMIRYVSCDPATLARDLAPLVAAGYRIEEAHLFDLFPETFHIESVMLLAR